MKNYLIPAYIKGASLKRNHFFLGMWCHDFTKKNIFSDFEKYNTLTYHWKNKKKLIKDYKYLKNVNEKVLKSLSANLNKIHKVNNKKIYWRTILFPWLSQYTSIIYDRWEAYRLFLNRYKNRKFYIYDVLPDDFHTTSTNHEDFFLKASSSHEWNHYIFKRISFYLKSKKILPVKKNRELVKENKYEYWGFKEKNSLIKKFFYLVSRPFSYFAFKYNRIIFESFFFPKKEYLKLCIRNNLIPTRYGNFFTRSDNYFDQNQDKRIDLDKLFYKKKTKKDFMNFLLNNISKDLPKSYLENFDLLKYKASKLANTKKIIFSMHGIHYNDFFKIYSAEAKKNGSKLILSDHGGGLKRKLNMIDNYHERIADKKISWDRTNKKSFFLKLSPTLPIIAKTKINKKPNNQFFTIIYAECSRYQTRVQSIPFLNDDVKDFVNIVKLTKGLRSNIKKRLKFRLKQTLSINSEKIFSDLFGRRTIDTPTKHNTYYRSLINSKLVLMTYPTTSFSESMQLNIPTILVCKKETWQFEKSSLKMFNSLKKNKIAFENFVEARKHINNSWDKVDSWWNDKKVQDVRKKYLKNFFNVNANWYDEWLNYLKIIKNSK